MDSPARRSLSRRLFLAHLSALSAAGVMMPCVGADAAPAPIEILGLRLRTSRPIRAMKAYYADRLGFPVVRESERSITFGAGRSTLAFEHVPGLDAFYHFAFTIPENRIDSALAWARSRGCALIRPPRRLNEPGRPREIVAFRHWNAHSVFFWDPAGNAVELIARHDLASAADASFSATAILAISEIGLVVDDVPAAATHLRRTLDAPTYIGANAAFVPIGDPHGLLLVMTTGHPMAFGQGRPRGVYPTDVRLRRGAGVRCGVEGYPYVLRGPTGDDPPIPDDVKRPEHRDNHNAGAARGQRRRER